MSNKSYCKGHDLESQQPSRPCSSPSDRWRKISLVLLACQTFISKAENAKKNALALMGASSTTTSHAITDITDAGDGDLELTGSSKILSTTPQVPINVHCDSDGDHNRSNIKHQHANIARIVKAKDLVSLQKFGGVQGVAEALDSHLEDGIPGNEEDLVSRRTAAPLSETEPPAQGFFGFLLKSWNTYIIFLLLLSAVLSIGFGIKKEGARTGWYEGVIIILAAIILVVTPLMRDYCQESLKKFSRKQNLSKKSEMVVDVFRGGCQRKISISDVVLGDVVCLKRGHHVPADGLFISGEFLALDGCLESIDDQNPFMFYGSKVINGKGRMLVTCVGVDTAWGELMNRVTHTPNRTQLQAHLDQLSNHTQVIGLIISILILVVLFLRFELGKDDDASRDLDLKEKPNANKEIMEAVSKMVTKPYGKISLLTTSVTMLLVGIVEGLPIVIFLAITYINKKTFSQKALAQDISACVTMGLVTTMCIDKIGGITLNPMEVDMCWIGEEVIAEDSVIAQEVLEALCDGISTTLLNQIQQSPCSSTNDLLLSWAALKIGMKKMEILKQSCTIVEAKEAYCNDEAGGVLMRKNGDDETNMCLLHWKGPAMTILAMCSRYYDSKGTIKVMDENKRMDFEQRIEHMQSKHLKTIAFAYKQTDVPCLEENNLILIGLLGIKQTCWRETRKAMEDCTNAGVNIKLVSEDNVSELKAIAEKCGLLMPNSGAIVLEGKDFRNLTDERRMEMVDQIAVMGNSLPSDRLLLVQCLKQKGHIVAVAGVRTTETPALKEADVGLAMGTWSTEMARESSDIIVWDDNFSFLVTIVRCGRSAYDNIRRYIQVELTMMISGLLITSIMIVFSGHVHITTIQLVWANLIVMVLAGLEMLTEPPIEKLMDKRQVSRTEPLITKVMWRNIVIQTLYQAAIIVSFMYKGHVILGINRKVGKSMIFNSFVLCQVFNQFNARDLEEKNVFKGIHKNHWFWVALGVTVVFQAGFIETASILTGTARLNWEQWAMCSLIGIVSWVIHWAGNCTWDFIKG